MVQQENVMMVIMKKCNYSVKYKLYNKQQSIEIRLGIKFRQLQFAFNFPSSPVTRPTVYNAKEISRKKFIFLEHFAKFELQNSNLPSIFLRSCESRMSVTTMASHEEDAGSDELSDDSDEEVFSETFKLEKAASCH